MSYDEANPYRIRVLRGGDSEQGQDPVTGLPTGPSYNRTVCDWTGDAQDAGESRPRSASGMPSLNADATWFFQEDVPRDDFLEIAPDDSFELFYPNSERKATGEVLFVREMDLSLLLRFR